MTRIVGVDAGGSKTYAVLVDERGNLLGTGLAGRGNHQSAGIHAALSQIKKSIELALQEAALSWDDIDYFQYGLAGADRDKDYDILRPALAALPCRNWGLVCDTMEGLRVGSSDYTGVVLVCGTGTNAAGRNPQGQSVQTGGFGFLYGDGAGGSDMAIATFRAAVRSWELRESPSLLTDLVPRHLGYDTMEQLWNDYLDKDIYSVPAHLTLVLHDAADQGDEAAGSILAQTGRELGLAAISVIRRLGGFEELAKIPIVLVGSILTKGRSPHLLKALSDTLEQENLAYELVIPEAAPVYGAVMIAMDTLGIEIDDGMKQKFIQYGGHDK
ncbi:N-acetylglucosamine kinase [Cohnella faecalis]|uniref:ATPase n=1 Tax=Cohnella faecalis TaxID=2315694 RepID=A0A398CPT8_9BACL|nr:BadF/BadG/BcrA/BcrD ATPase family protein [Cohnella faecalis]RIE00984.1 ATPase [Cohnella faecalis]